MSKFRLLAAGSLLLGAALAQAQTATTSTGATTTSGSTTTTSSTTATVSGTSATVSGTSATTVQPTTGPLSQAMTSVNKNLVRDPDNKGLQNAAERLQDNRERHDARKLALSQRIETARAERLERAERPQRPERPERAGRPGR